MASYAALLSLTHTIHQITNHPRPPITLHKKQVDSLMEIVTFLQDFLQRYSTEDNGDLEGRIAIAAYASEDAIESHVVDQIHARSTSLVETISSVDFYGGLERVKQDLDLIRKEVMEIIKHKMGAQRIEQLHRNSSFSTASTWQSTPMAEFDDVFLTQVLDKLTGQQFDLQIICIVGMGGIGKTTLARSIYSNSLIVQHFDILAWATISQGYSCREILSQLLCQITSKNDFDFGEMSEDDLGETLHKYLWGRRFLIVMDDMWSTWDRVRYFFPDNYIGSRIMITTRLTNLASQLCNSHDFHMSFLADDKSWNLLCDIVFGKEQRCPVELEEVGKEIARKCRGLPLSLVVIGGLLRKSNPTPPFWEHTLQNLNSVINLENDEYCLQVLRTSYKDLPVHLRPCFLYIGVFPEDGKIRVSRLVRLWVAEGFLRPIDGKRLEEVAEEYLKELVDRNLILVEEFRWNGKAKVCKIHDLLRDLCLREAKKHRFLGTLNITDDTCIEPRICIPQILHVLTAASLVRSVPLTRGFLEPSATLHSRLVRVYRYSEGGVINLNSSQVIFQQANLRYLSLKFDPTSLSRFTSLCSLLWNLQTLKVVIPILLWEPVIAPPEIWEMCHLRHALLRGVQLPDPPNAHANVVVLKNLHTLSYVKNFKCPEEVVERIPNINTLKVQYFTDRLVQDEGYLTNLCLNNLGHLLNLESLNLYICFSWKLVKDITFPHSLKKLSLSGTMLVWEEVTTKIGSLPLFEYLKLSSDACRGPTWATIEGQFCSLKILKIGSSFQRFDLTYWETDDSHFPRLEHLFLEYLLNLEEVPSSIGDIPTLKSINLIWCSKSADDSARRIKEEQEGYGNEDLQVIIDSRRM